MDDKRLSLFHIFILCCAAAVWAFLFRDFLLGRISPFSDASAYYEHIRFYIDNITRGIYPLWDPLRDHGAPNGFYLRRIGEFNPFYWLVALFDKMGVGQLAAYQMFMGIYYMLGISGFYLLARRVLSDGRAALLAAVLLMFSSLSSQPFESYLMIIFTPGVWFFYFLASFYAQPSRWAMLGVVFTLMITVITYIPFYFVTALLLAMPVFTAIYWGQVIESAGRARHFIKANKAFTIFCAACLAASLLPGILWYKQAGKAEALVTFRHQGASLAHPAAVNIDRVNAGGIITPKLVDQTLVDLDRKHLGDFYVSLLLWLVLAAGAFSLADRRMVFMCAWGLLIYMVGAADASFFHKFLYDHVFFFKYFRNTHFFVPLVLLPLLALLAAAILEQTLRMPPRTRAGRIAALAYVAVIHAAATLFFIFQDNGTIASTYVTIALSFVFFALHALGKIKPGAWWPAALLVAAALAQPVQYQAQFSREYANLRMREYTGDYFQLKNISGFVLPPHFATRWFNELYATMDRDHLQAYLEHRVIAYDRLQPVNEDNLDIGDIGAKMAALAPAAFVPKDQVQGVALSNGAAVPQAQAIDLGAGMMQVKAFKPNEVVFSTHFPQDKFIVYNDNYASGWKAFCDGKPITLLRANLSFKGFWVPAGDHVVALKFDRPLETAIGWTFIFFFTGTFIYLLLLWRKERP